MRYRTIPSDDHIKLMHQALYHAQETSNNIHIHVQAIYSAIAHLPTRLIVPDPSGEYDGPIVSVDEINKLCQRIDSMSADVQAFNTLLNRMIEREVARTKLQQLDGQL